METLKTREGYHFEVGVEVGRLRLHLCTPDGGSTPYNVLQVCDGAFEVYYVHDRVCECSSVENALTVCAALDRCGCAF